MEFAFTEEQDAIRDTARRFAAERLAPDFHQRELDRFIGRDVISEMSALGLIGADLPEEFCGLGQDCVTAGIVIEETAAADLSGSYIQLIASLSGKLLASHAAPDHAAKTIGDLCAGTSITALWLTDPGAGSDSAILTLSA